MQKATYDTVWTGRYPNLCHGTWELYRNGRPLDVDIPFNHGDPYSAEDAGTEGDYPTWSFTCDWDEEWDTVHEGKPCAEWCAEHAAWLATFAPEEDWPAVFAAFQASDWRHGSCGGCI